MALLAPSLLPSSLNTSKGLNQKVNELNRETSKTVLGHLYDSAIGRLNNVTTAEIEQNSIHEVERVK